MADNYSDAYTFKPVSSFKIDEYSEITTWIDGELKHQSMAGIASVQVTVAASRIR